MNHRQTGMKYVQSLNKKIQISVWSNFVNYIKTI